MWRFISPALHYEENNAAKGVVFFSSSLFLIGVLFGYYIVSPLSVHFLGSYQVSQTVANQISLSSFISTVTTVCLANGVVFELPILVYFLTKIGLLTPEFMRTYRKHALVLTLIFSAIITPPDVTSQILVAFPLIVLYEISIKISARVLRKQKNN
jgi:sec-independent protein translocase protein TatC